jgi:hypothetical protein
LSVRMTRLTCTTRHPGERPPCDRVPFAGLDGVVKNFRSRARGCEGRPCPSRHFDATHGHLVAVARVAVGHGDVGAVRPITPRWPCRRDAAAEALHELERPCRALWSRGREIITPEMSGSMRLHHARGADA